MKHHGRSILPLIGLILILSPRLLLSEEKSPARYIGVDACTKCHKTKGSGNQLAAWQASAHARAWQTLGSDQAFDITKKLGISEDPQRSARCLACHTTAAGVPKAQLEDGFDVTQGVQCEACHGPGSNYAKIEHMIKRTNARAEGLVEPNAALCKRCHNAKSPTFKGFDWAKAVKKIAHPLAPM